MAAGFPAKADYATGDVLTAVNMNDLSGTVNLINPSAKGDLYVGSAANTYTKLTVGANDTVLTADSATATGLKWATPQSGGMTELATGTLSGASVSITSISGSYKNLQLIVRDYLPATDSTSLSMRINNETSTVYLAQETNAANLSFNATSWSILSTNDDTVANGLSIVDLFDYANDVTRKVGRVVGNATNATTTANVNVRTVTLHSSITAAITQIDLFPSTGNFTSGSYILYGVN